MMTDLVISLLLLILSSCCYSQSSSIELRQDPNTGDILLAQNNIIQDTVGKFRMQIWLQDFYIIDQDNMQYIVLDDYYNYWLAQQEGITTPGTLNMNNSLVLVEASNANLFQNSNFLHQELFKN